MSLWRAAANSGGDPRCGRADHPVPAAVRPLGGRYAPPGRRRQRDPQRQSRPQRHRQPTGRAAPTAAGWLGRHVPAARPIVRMVLLAAMLLLVARLVDVQVLHSGSYQAAAAPGESAITVSLPSVRGGSTPATGRRSHSPCRPTTSWPTTSRSPTRCRRRMPWRRCCTCRPPRSPGAAPAFRVT